jgi:Na+-translocating ferredoxin:NAD+ oxidoreductase RnfG subunit
MNLKKLCLAMIAVSTSLSAATTDIAKQQIQDRAKVKQISMTAQDKNGHLIEFGVNSDCGREYQGLGKIIMSDRAAQDEALLLQFKYGPAAAKQFMHYWNSKASETASRLPTVAMVIYPEEGQPMASLLADDKNRQQKLATINKSDALKIMAVKDGTAESGISGEIVVFVCGAKEHHPALQ